MEGVSTTVYKGLRGYWRRRGYQKLNGSGRRRSSKVELGSAAGGRRRVWRVKVSPKLKLARVMSAPKKLLVWLRDAYVNMMLKLAGSRTFTAGYGGGFGGALGYGGDGMGTGGFGSGPAQLKEYDQKMIVEIYKSLVIAQGLVPRDAGGLAMRLSANGNCN